jgi:ubiquinone biosynthesis protein COQ9
MSESKTRNLSEYEKTVILAASQIFAIQSPTAHTISRTDAMIQDAVEDAFKIADRVVKENRSKK